jgi:phenylalanyl-tRNA synthetase alpha chain
MKQSLDTIRSAAIADISATDSSENLESLRVHYLGKKGELTQILRTMKDLSPEERPTMGQLANEVRAHLEQSIN